MKKITLLLSVITIGLFACKKDSTSNPKNSNTVSTPKSISISFSSYQAGDVVSFDSLHVWYGQQDTVKWNSGKTEVVAYNDTLVGVYQIGWVSPIYSYTIPQFTVPAGTTYIVFAIPFNSNVFTININGNSASLPSGPGQYAYFYYNIQTGTFSYNSLIKEIIFYVN